MWSPRAGRTHPRPTLSRCTIKQNLSFLLAKQMALIKTGGNKAESTYAQPVVFWSNRVVDAGYAGHKAARLLPITGVEGILLRSSGSARVFLRLFHSVEERRKGVRVQCRRARKKRLF